MKKQIIFIIGILLIASCNFNPLDTVTNKTFEDANEILNLRLDSIETIVIKISADTDTLKATQQVLIRNQEILKNNQDTLKKGQEYIYSAVTSNNRGVLRRLIENW